MFSVVIPCYNVAKYITNCLDSLYANVKDFEIILINDGSTDDLIEVCRKYFHLDSDRLISSEYSFSFNGGGVTFINQYNMGVSVARNIGINKSNGDYIVFVDPDDTVAPDLISSLFRKIEGNSFDMVIYGFDTQYGDREEKSVTLPKLSRDLFGNEARIECLLPHYIGYSVEHVRNWLKSGIFDNEKEFGSIWRVAYRRDFLLDYDIYFDKDIFYNEDEIFNSMCISQAESVGVLPMNLYHYVIRSSGVMMRGLADKLVHNRIALLKAREKIVLNMEKNGIELFAGSTIFSIFEMMTLLEIDSWPDIKRYINFPSVQKSIRMMPIGSKLKYTVPVLLLKMRMYLILFVTIKLLK